MNQDEIDQWAASPLNEELARLIKKYIENYEVKDIFHPYQPHKTQETLAGVVMMTSVWETVIEILKGDWSHIEEIEDEYIGDTPEGE